MQNGKLGVGKLWNLINVPQRKLQDFQLRDFGFGYSAKWKTKMWKTSKFDQCGSEKTPGFQLPVLGILLNGKLQVEKLIL